VSREDWIYNVMARNGICFIPSSRPHSRPADTPLIEPEVFRQVSLTTVPGRRFFLPLSGPSFRAVKRYPWQCPA